MKTGSRILIVLLLLLGILFLAQAGVAWAGKSTEQNALVDNEVSQDILLDEDGEDEPGSVKAPPKFVVIKKSGTYSVGGFCTMDVSFDANDLKAVVYMRRPLPGPLPDGVHKVRQGCRVDYYQSQQPISELQTQMGSAKICFAAIPKKEMTIYFYDVNDTPPAWTALQTTVENRVACASASGTGIYIATFKKP